MISQIAIPVLGQFALLHLCVESLEQPIDAAPLEGKVSTMTMLENHLEQIALSARSIADLQSVCLIPFVLPR